MAQRTKAHNVTSFYVPSFLSDDYFKPAPGRDQQELAPYRKYAYQFKIDSSSLDVEFSSIGQSVKLEVGPFAPVVVINARRQFVDALSYFDGSIDFNLRMTCENVSKVLIENFGLFVPFAGTTDCIRRAVRFTDRYDDKCVCDKCKTSKRKPLGVRPYWSMTQFCRNLPVINNGLEVYDFSSVVAATGTSERNRIFSATLNAMRVTSQNPVELFNGMRKPLLSLLTLEERSRHNAKSIAIDRVCAYLTPLIAFPMSHPLKQMNVNVAAASMFRINGYRKFVSDKATGIQLESELYNTRFESDSEFDVKRLFASAITVRSPEVVRRRKEQKKMVRVDRRAKDARKFKEDGQR